MLWFRLETFTLDAKRVEAVDWAVAPDSASEGAQIAMSYVVRSNGCLSSSSPLPPSMEVSIKSLPNIKSAWKHPLSFLGQQSSANNRKRLKIAQVSFSGPGKLSPLLSLNSGKALT